MANIEKLKYPIGKFERPGKLSKKERAQMIKAIKRLPKRLSKAVEGLSEKQLNTPYRKGGWTVAQVVHHLADSHINSYVRFKWTLTEDTPMIKAYDETLWAVTDDAKSTDISASLQILKGIHKRWGIVLDQMSKSDFDRELAHPEWSKNLSLHTMLALYAWHSKHHVAQITELTKRKNW